VVALPMMAGATNFGALGLVAHLALQAAHIGEFRVESWLCHRPGRAMSRAGRCPR